MKRVAFFDTKQYDREWFDRIDKSFEMFHVFCHCIGLELILEKKSFEVVYKTGIQILEFNMASKFGQQHIGSQSVPFGTFFCLR